ncbi:MAG: accessory factor UbiK family protein [Proteobacteria bacterium]|nr:accessory factor UbiK family protein [Pseudomonadota bacterium]
MGGNKIFQDISKFANTAAETASNITKDAVSISKSYIESIIKEMDFVKSEELEVAMHLIEKQAGEINALKDLLAKHGIKDLDDKKDAKDQNANNI